MAWKMGQKIIQMPVQMDKKMSILKTEVQRQKGQSEAAHLHLTGVLEGEAIEKEQGYYLKRRSLKFFRTDKKCQSIDFKSPTNSQDGK